MQAVNFPFIKSIHFEEIEVENNDKLNRRIKSEFLMFLNCRKWRYMNLVRHGTEDNPYCEIALQDNVLYIKANRQLTQIFYEVVQKFENIEWNQICRIAKI